MLKNIIFTLLFFGQISLVHSEEPDHEIHEELRTLLSGVESAVNKKDFTNLSPYFHKNLRVTTVNQNTIFSYDELDNYFADWFGDDGYIKSLEMSLKPDALTEFYNNKTMGIVRGSGIEKYKLTDGRDLNLKTRWTATVLKSDDGQWKILSLHLGANFYDNPIYHESRSALTKLGILGTVIGIILGLLIGLLLWRKKPKS